MKTVQTICKSSLTLEPLLTSTDRRHHGLQAAAHHAYSLVTSCCIYYAPALEGAFWDSTIRPSVCRMAQLARL